MSIPRLSWSLLDGIKVDWIFWAGAGPAEAHLHSALGVANYGSIAFCSDSGCSSFDDI